MVRLTSMQQICLTLTRCAALPGEQAGTFVRAVSPGAVVPPKHQVGRCERRIPKAALFSGLTQQEGKERGPGEGAREHRAGHPIVAAWHHHGCPGLAGAAVLLAHTVMYMRGIKRHTWAH